MKKRSIFSINLIPLVMALIILALGWSSKSLAIKPIRLVVDGKDITSSAMPIFENDRTLVPIRFIAEELGADVGWNNEERKVTIEKENTSVVLKIDSHLVQYNEEEKTDYGLSDVAPKIIGDRTYVPVRLVSNALGIGIEWDNDNRIVNVDSSKKSNIEPFFDMRISSIKPGQAITGKTDLQIELNGMDTSNASEIKYLLLDPDTAEGIVVNRGKDLEAKYTWLPRLESKGKKVLVAAIYNDKGEFIAGDVVPVNMKVTPKVSLKGIKEGDILEEISLVPDINFVAYYVKYEITNLDKNTTTTTDIQDPQDSYTWSHMVENNGNYSLKVIAYDKDNNPYESDEINVQIQLPRKLSLIGVSSGQTIDKPITLMASRNFNVNNTQYILRDPITKKEEVLTTVPYGSYTWFPGPEYKGTKEVLVRVEDTRGRTHDSEAVKINLLGTPKLLLQGIGPKQVITNEVKLKANSNVNIDKVDYIAINPDTNKEIILANNMNPKEEFIFNPETLGEGNWNIKAQGKYEGNSISSEIIPIKIYLGKIHGKQAVIEKDKFLGVASNLARRSWEKTGLSAALQTAQSILETGWGQYVGVDKYTGKLSYNLFGIKGEGPAGSVTIRTWEVYNGVRYDVDADFRAYNNMEESWMDYNDLLLEGNRYEPLREVMHDSHQGAWALKRSGYATDPKYAIKLIEIIDLYNLEELDKIKI